MPNIRYKTLTWLCQVDIKKGFVVVHVRSTATIVFGASCFSCIGASCYNCNNVLAARTDGSSSDLCADKDWNNNIKLVNALFHLYMSEGFITHR